MIINKIILENIKSYKYEEIDFSEGINCILGLNGSGKSTIIESIGIGLFNFVKSSTISSVLRYNETKGSIEIIFTANDERMYKVVRTIRPKANTVKIYDYEKNIELYNNVNDVYSFIRNVLKIKKTRDFNRLFEQVLAVPQGQYVNSFLEKPSTRKETFDRLFDLHIYKEISDKVKGLNDEIQKEKIAKVKEEIKLIEGQIINFDEETQKGKKIELQLLELNEKQTRLDNEFNTNLIFKRKLEELKFNLENAKNSKIINETKLSSYLSEKSRVTELLNSSLRSKVIVEENLSKYMEYENNIEIIRELEIKIKRNQKLEEENQIIIKNIELIEKDLDNIYSNKQDKEKILDQYKKQLEEIFNDTYLQKFKLEENQKKYELDKKEFEKNLEDNNKIISLLNEKIKDIQMYQERLIDTDYLLIDNGTNDVNQLEKIDLELKQVDGIIEQINELKKELNKVENQRQINFNNSKSTQNGLCPFLNQKCKNINEESLNSHFEDLINDNDIRITQLVNEIDFLDKKTFNRKHLIEEKNNIQNKINLYQNDLDRRNKIINQFKSKYLELMDEGLTINDNIKNILTDLETKLNQKNNLALELNSKKDYLIKLRTENDSQIFQINLKEKNAKDLQLKIKDLEKEIDELTLKINLLKRTKEETIKSKKVIEEKLSSNNKDKESLEKLKTANQSLIQYRDLYTVNFEKSKEVDKYEKSAQEFNKITSELEIKIEELKNQIDVLNAEYSIEKYNETLKIHENLIKNISENKAIMEEKNKQLKEIKEKIEFMLILKEELKVNQNKLDSYQNSVKFLSYMRDIYNRLPQELSKRYREYVAYMATNSYRAISNELVHIEIQDDYGISLIDDKNPKNIKTIDQLSGGEQMSVALSVRFAMLKQLSGLDIYFLDEPTINLDFQRRTNIADVVLEISQELSQMFVISHDDTFDDITERVIKIEKEENISRVK